MGMPCRHIICKKNNENLLECCHPRWFKEKEVIKSMKQLRKNEQMENQNENGDEQKNGNNDGDDDDEYQNQKRRDGTPISPKKKIQELNLANFQSNLKKMNSMTDNPILLSQLNLHLDAFFTEMREHSQLFGEV